jgi:LysR family transcriptional activator of nhaA
MYNYNHLYYFYVTVKSGGVTNASKHLRISQPSLSSQLKVLENSLDIKLFNKVGRCNQVTPEGSVVLGFCRQMFELSEEMHELISKDIPYASRRLHIGVSREVAPSFVTEVISHFFKKFDEDMSPKVTLTSGEHVDLAEQLRFREVDAVITHFAMTSPDLNNMQKVEAPVNLIYSAKQNRTRGVKSTNIVSTIKSVAGKGELQWVMPRTGLKLRTEINQFFEINSIKGRVVTESDIMESITRNVIDQIGIAFMPMIYISRELKAKSLLRLGPKRGYWKHRLWFTCHTQNQNDPLVEAFGVSFKEISKLL